MPRDDRLDLGVVGLDLLWKFYMGQRLEPNRCILNEMCLYRVHSMCLHRVSIEVNKFINLGLGTTVLA